MTHHAIRGGTDQPGTIRDCWGQNNGLACKVSAQNLELLENYRCFYMTPILYDTSCH